MSLVRWSPSRDLFGIDKEMSRMVDHFFSPEWFSSDTAANWLPNMDVIEDSDKYLVSLELPGLSKDDVKITYKEGYLTIEGERKQEEESKDKSYHRVERRYGKFLRSFEVPAMVKESKIDAQFKDGVLTISLPKAEEVKPKQIEVKIG